MKLSLLLPDGNGYWVDVARLAKSLESGNNLDWKLERVVIRKGLQVIKHLPLAGNHVSSIEDTYDTVF